MEKEIERHLIFFDKMLMLNNISFKAIMELMTSKGGKEKIEGLIQKSQTLLEKIDVYASDTKTEDMESIFWGDQMRTMLKQINILKKFKADNYDHYNPEFLAAGVYVLSFIQSFVDPRLAEIIE